MENTEETIKENYDYSIKNDEYLLMLQEIKQKNKAVVSQFPMKISPYYYSLIDWDDDNDPIKRMAIPSHEELAYKDVGEITCEQDNTKLFGLQHKYKQTALVLISNDCAMYCRYCFRKRFVGLHNNELVKNFDNIVEYIREHPEINNVLLSGGDPLLLPNKSLEIILSKLDQIDTLKFIRIGTKVPVTLPSRITESIELQEIFRKHSRRSRRIIIQTHFNHSKEITPQSISAIDALMDANLLIQNQTVLLKGVNDDPQVLSELMNNLISIGVNPYYIFQCRPFIKKKPSDFQVSFSQGIEIIKETKRRLSGPAKKFRFALSHKWGKIEILGRAGNQYHFKFHQSKYPEKIGELFTKELIDEEVWLWDGY